MADHENLTVETQKRDGSITIRASGFATDKNLIEFERALNETQSVDGLVVDLSDLNYMCSWGLGVLVERARALEEKGGRLVVVKPRTRLWKLFELLQLNVLLHFVDDLESVAQATSKASGSSE